MENKNFDNPAEIFFSDVTAAVIPNEQAAEYKKNLRKQINKEKKTKRVQLTLSPTAYEKAQAIVDLEGGSFNNYIQNLIINDILK